VRHNHWVGCISTQNNTWPFSYLVECHRISESILLDGGENGRKAHKGRWKDCQHTRLCENVFILEVTKRAVSVQESSRKRFREVEIREGGTFPLGKGLAYMSSKLLRRASLLFPTPTNVFINVSFTSEGNRSFSMV
jgi:hypothetical protein